MVNSLERTGSIPWHLGPGESSDQPESALLASDPVAFLREGYRRHGAVFLTRFRGGTWTVIAGMDANDFAFRNADAWSFEQGVPGFREELGHTHVTQLDGKPHVRKRRLLKPGFSAEAMGRWIATLGAETTACVSAFPAGTPFNLFPALLETFIRFNSRTQLRVDISPEWLAKCARFEEDLMFGINVSADRQDYFGGEHYCSLKLEVFRYLDELVQLRLDGQRAEDNLQAILDEEAPGFEPLDAAELRSVAYLLLIAGIENTAKLVLKVLERLATTPDWLAEVRAEVSASGAGAFATGMGAFPKLKATIMECERLHPGSVALSMVTARAFELGGHEIHGGTRVLHAHTLPHFLEEIYDEPFAFRPSRWLTREYPKKAHATFGSGTHACLGINVTRIHTPLILAEVIRRFDIALHYETDFTNRLGDGRRQIRPENPVTLTPLS